MSATNSHSAARSPTRAAIWACAEWLEFCVRIGWDKATLDRLQEIWWQFHDDKGNLI